MVPHWTAKYIGLPFTEHGRDWSGLDCWGLTRLVYQEELGIELPSYAESYRTTTDALEIQQLIECECQAGRSWLYVEQADVLPFDIVILRMRGLPMHCGVVIDHPRFLHIALGMNAVIDRYDAPRWRYRVSSFWRHTYLAPPEISRHKLKLTHYWGVSS